MTIGANGGTIDVGANAVTIAAPVSGTGTITVKGTGSLTFTGGMSGFCGAVVVETSGCTVTLPASATKAVPGANTSASNGVYSYSANTTHHDWWTGDSSTDWATAGNWGRFLIDEGTTGYDINEWNDNTINFASVVNISKPLTITENDPDKSYNVEFTASSASDGLVSTDVLNVGTSNEGMATFTSGTYSFNNMYVGGSGATGSVTVNGASLTITTGDPQIGNGGTGTFTLSSGFVSFGYAGSAKWAFLKGGTINLDGGEMAVCRLNCDTAPAVINFNGGTLTSYNDGYSKDNIIENDANWTLNVKAGGAKFNIPSGLTTTVNQVLAGDAESTGGGLTKLGPGTLILAVAPTFNGGITLHEGSIVIPDTYAENDVMTDVEGYDVSVATGSGVKTYTLTKKTYTDADIAAATQIISSKSVTVDVANEAQFIGTVNTKGLIKNGSGSLTLFGQNTIAGSVVVNYGVLKLAASPRVLSGVVFDFDASYNSDVLINTEGEFAWKDASGGSIFLSSDGTVSPSLQKIGEMNYVYSENLRVWTTMTTKPEMLYMVWRLNGVGGGWPAPVRNNTNNANNNWRITVPSKVTSSGSQNYRIEGSSSSDRTTSSIWSNGNSPAAAIVDTTQLLTVGDSRWYRSDANSSKKTWFASDYDASIGEILGFAEVMTDPQRNTVNAYLMNKWGINDTAWGVDYSEAEVTVASGATLDLGGGAWTFDSLSASGNGIATVQNGNLTITSPISLSDGQILKIPASSTYTLAEGVRATTSDGVTTLSTAAAHVGSTPFQTVQAAIDAIVAGTATGTLTIHESATVNLSTTADSITDVVLDDGVDLAFAANLPWQASYSDGTIVNQRVASTFVWTPQNNSTDWATLGNWKIGTTVAAALPGENDTIEFPEKDGEGGLDVSLDGTKKVYAIVAKGPVSLAGALISAINVSGEGMISLTGNAGFIAEGGKTLTITANLKINGTGNKLQGESTYATTIFSGNVTGDGEISLTGKRATFTLSGDWREFAGTVNVVGDGIERNKTTITSEYATSSNAVWNVTNSNDEGHLDSCFWQVESKTLYFGALNGTVRSHAKYHNTLEIGARNVDCAFGGRIGATKQNHIKKVGTAKLTFTGSDLGNVDITNGVFAIGGAFTSKEVTDEIDSSVTTSGGITSVPIGTISFTGDNAILAVSATLTKSHYTTNSVDGGAATLVSTDDPVFADPSAKIAGNSTYPICFSNAVNETHTWGTALAATNTKGLKKLGAGTLKLSYAPAYAGFEITVAENGGSVILPKDANITLGDYTVVSAETETTKTLVYAATVNVTGLAHDHATATVTAGGETVTVTEGIAAVPVGSNVVIIWTPAAGYQIDAGEKQELSDIREAKVANAPTVSELPTVSIAAPEVGAYGNDFATVSVTAEVTSTYPAATTITYTLKANGTAIATTTAAGDATSVTFGNANVSGLTRYGNISYTVEASGESVTAATSGATTAMLADSERWVDEKKSTTEMTGSWKDAVTYGDDDRVQLSDNKFSATNCSTGDVVTVTIKDVIYTALSDTSTVDGDAQGSIALGGTESAPKFMVLTKSGDTVQWSEAAGVDPLLNTPYTIVFTFDYNNNTYSITVNGTALKVGGSETYGIVKTDNKYVKDIDFLGAGSIKAIEGIRYDAMMAVDQNGDRYATVAESLNANKGVKGAIIKLLHGTSNTNIAGWSYNAGTMTFIKKAMGIVFLAF